MPKVIKIICLTLDGCIHRIPVYQGIRGKYYIIDGVKYDIHFPVQWTLTHKSGSGPVYCKNCKESGSIRGVHVFYCANCRNDIYHGKRGKETIYDPKKLNQFQMEKFFSYLKGVSIHLIGDEEVVIRGKHSEQYRYFIDIVNDELDDHRDDNDVIDMYDGFDYEEPYDEDPEELYERIRVYEEDD